LVGADEFALVPMDEPETDEAEGDHHHAPDEVDVDALWHPF